MPTEVKAPKAIRKTVDVPFEQIAKSDDGILRAVITAEIPDSDGDVVVVEGMKWPRYDESNPLPVLSSHLRKLPDGRPSQIGYATKIYRTVASVKGQSVPAVVMEWQWLDTELAREWKEVARKMGRLSFSIGASVLEAQPIEKNGSVEGFRFSSTELTEVSVVTVPANPAALSMNETTGTDAMTKEQIDTFIKGYEKIDDALVQLMSTVEAIETRLDEIASHKTVAANEADEPNETTKAQPSDELSERLNDLLNKIKTIKSTEQSSNGNNGDSTDAQ
jgi:hypothetical protein